MLTSEFKFGEVHDLASQVQPAEDRVHVKNIFSNNHGGVAIIGFKAGQKLDTHMAPAEVMINVLEGEIEFTMLEKPNHLRAGQFILMGQDVPHSVAALTDAKLLLIKIKP